MSLASLACPTRLTRAAAVTALTLALVAPAVPRAQGADEFAPLVARLETAALSGHIANLKDARTACLRLLAAAPTGDRAAVLRYTVAYADWRLAFLPALSAAEQQGFIHEADDQLHEAIKIDGRFADALGLLSAVYGGEISKNPDLKMSLGPESTDLLGRAISIEPDNPRLLVLTGQNLLRRPPEYGGSPSEAAATLRRALAAFDREPAAKPWPNWGRFDAHVWLGQALVAIGDNAGAKAEYERALVIAPDSAYVRYTLLPAVSK